MGVAAEVAQDLLGSRHGGLGVDDEVLGRGSPQQETARDFTHAQAPFYEGELEGLKELPPKHLGQPQDRQEVGRLGGDPALAVQAQASSGGDAVDVRVMLELLIPGVELGNEAGGGPEIAPAHVDHGLCRGFEQQRVRFVGVL